MNIKIGDFLLVKSAKYGISDKCDLGPFIVKVLKLDVSGIFTEHRISHVSHSRGWDSYESVVCKIHDRDVATLFEEELKG